MNCPNCNTPIQPGAAFCENCGSALSSMPSSLAGPVAAPVAGGGLTCPQCRTPAMPGEAFCGNCGAALPQSGATPPPPAYPPLAPPAVSLPGGGGSIICSQCRTSLQPGSMFCDNCGAPVTGGAAQPPLQQPSQPPQWQQPAQQPPQWQQPAQQPPQQQPWSPGPTIAPRLVVQATNTSLNFPMGKSELVIGREDPVSGHFPDVNLGPHGGEDGGVSRSHAKLIIQGNQCFLEDSNSVNYTHVNRQRLTPGTRHPLRNGDELRFGKIVVMFYTQ